ncbi:MAG: hypothetical protein ACR2KW_06460 [Rubrobacter sp.]
MIRELQNVARHVIRTSPQGRLLHRHRLGEHPDGRQVGVLQVALQAAVLKDGPGVIPDREQHLVFVVLEAVRVVRADHHPVELVPDEDGDGEEVFDLIIRRRSVVAEGGMCFPDRTIPLHDFSGEPPDQRAPRRVVLETFVCKKPEALIFGTTARKEYPLLRPDELHHEPEYHGRDVVTIGEQATLTVESHHLGVQLRPPLLDRAVRLLGTRPQITLPTKFFLSPVTPISQGFLCPQGLLRPRMLLLRLFTGVS